VAGECAFRRDPLDAAFARRLLERSPTVTGLLEENPFPSGPPRFLRFRFNFTTFTDWKTLRRERRWWDKREAEPKPQLDIRPFTLADVQRLR
jgi:hypothetical protein